MLSIRVAMLEPQLPTGLVGVQMEPFQGVLKLDARGQGASLSTKSFVSKTLAVFFFHSISIRARVNRSAIDRQSDSTNPLVGARHHVQVRG